MAKIIDVEIRTNTSGVKTLRQELKESLILTQQLATADVIDEQALANAVKRTAELKDAMADVNEQVAQFASGSKYEQATSSLGQVGDAIRNLDFEKAQERAKSFGQIAKSITFGDAISSVKQLGSTMLNVGKAILTNPLFLIAGVVALIVVGIVKLMDKLGILKVIFEAVGDAIGWVVQQLKDFLDWLGLTNYAAEDAAAKQAESLGKIADATKQKNEEVIQGYDNEIRLAKLAGKNTEEMERKKVKALQETARARYEADKAAFDSAILKGDLDEKEIADLKEKVRVSRLAAKQASEDVKFFEATTANDKKLAQEKTAKDAEEANKKAREKRKAEQDKLKQEVDLVVQINKQAQRENELNAMEAKDREIAIINDKFKAQIDQAKKYKQDYSAIEELRLNEVNAIKTKYADAEEKKDEADRLVKEEKEKADSETRKGLLKDYNAFVISNMTDERLKFIAELDVKNEEEKIKLAEFRASKIINEQTYQDQLKAIEKNRIDQVAKYDEEAGEKEKARTKAVYDAKLQMASDTIGAINGLITEFSAKDEKSQKRAFEINKVASIGQAIMSAYLAANSALASPANNLFPGQNIIAAGIAATAGLSNVVKISKTQFGTKSASAGGGGGGSQASASTPQPSATPSFNLFGTGGQGNNLNASGQPNESNNQTFVVKAVVSETEITSTQNRVNSIQQSASL